MKSNRILTDRQTDRQTRITESSSCVKPEISENAVELC